MFPGSRQQLVSEWSNGQGHASDGEGESGSNRGDHFGKSVSVSGAHVLVGARYYDSPTKEDTGSAYTFEIAGLVLLAAIIGSVVLARKPEAGA